MKKKRIFYCRTSLLCDTRGNHKEVTFSFHFLPFFGRQSQPWRFFIPFFHPKKQFRMTLKNEVFIFRIQTTFFSRILYKYILSGWREKRRKSDEYRRSWDRANEPLTLSRGSGHLRLVTRSNILGLKAEIYGRVKFKLTVVGIRLLWTVNRHVTVKICFAPRNETGWTVTDTCYRFLQCANTRNICVSN